MFVAKGSQDTPQLRMTDKDAPTETDTWKLSDMEIPSIPPDDPLFSSEVLIVTPVVFKPTTEPSDDEQHDELTT
jgi:hypothetical protein